MENAKELKSLLVGVKQKVVEDSAAVELINHALSNLEQGVNIEKVVFDLKRDLNNYSLSHNFKLSQPLTELQLKLDENPNKWRDAGLTGSMSSTKNRYQISRNDIDYFYMSAIIYFSIKLSNSFNRFSKVLKASSK